MHICISASSVCEYSGAGIHVSNGASISVGYHRNNSVLVSTDDSADYRLRFYCLSGSDLYEQGELLGLDGKTITSDTFFNTTNEEPGSLVVMNSAAGGQEEITQSEQGVYTCRISDETGELREVGIGIYPAGFSCELALYWPSYDGAGFPKFV